VDRIENLVSGRFPDRPDENVRGDKESAKEAEPSILERLKHPVSTGGRITRQGEAQGAGQAGEVADDEPVEVSGVVTADSSAVEGGGGTSHVRAETRVEPRRYVDTADIDRRRERRSEFMVAFWFLVSAIATGFFVVINFIGGSHHRWYTPALGLSLAIAIGGLGIGLIHWAHQLMGDEEAVQDRTEHFASPEELQATERVFVRGLDTFGILRRPLIRRTLLLAGGMLGLVAVVPILNLGPLIGRRPRAFEETSWRFTSLVTDGDGKKIQGVRMIDQFGRAIKLGDLAAGGLLTVFPGIAKDELKNKPGFYPEPDLQVKGDSTVLLFRLRPGELKGKYKNGTYFDHIAFSKICTHAGCPVSLYEQQTHHLLCPCHQSIFDVTLGGRPIFGPAARPLPQLAITIDDEGYFIAKGDFNQPVGPSFWERT
jgi:ubiquinol-cytochrome c reductase iron-sulfur subunit